MSERAQAAPETCAAAHGMAARFSESEPLLSQTRGVLQDAGKLILYGGIYVILSAALIHYNQFLMQEGRFPFPAVLALLHMGAGSVMGMVLLWIAPHLYPSMSAILDKDNSIDRTFVMRGMLPIALCFSANLVLSNLAYEFATVPFLQMMKEANIVIVYILSVLVHLERFSSCNATVLLCIAATTYICVQGEARFSMAGFLIQASSQVFESLRLVLQALALRGSGRSLDPLTYNLLVMPLCFLCLSCFCGIFVASGTVKAPFPSREQWKQNLPALVPNVTLAFLLNMGIAVFMKKFAAVAYTLAGLAKDGSIVLISVMCFGAKVTRLQAFGFSLQLCGVFLWSMMKAFPKKFERGIFAGLISDMVKDPGRGEVGSRIARGDATGRVLAKQEKTQRCVSEGDNAIAAQAVQQTP